MTEPERPEEQEPYQGPDDELRSLKEDLESERQERARELRTEVRGTRLRPDEAQTLDRLAAAAGLDASNYIRLMCLGERPDTQALKSTLRQVCNLVREFAAACQDAPPTAEQVHALHKATEQACRLLA